MKTQIITSLSAYLLLWTILFVSIHFLNSCYTKSWVHDCQQIQDINFNLDWKRNKCRVWEYVLIEKEKLQSPGTKSASGQLHGHVRFEIGEEEWHRTEVTNIFISNFISIFFSIWNFNIPIHGSITHPQLSAFKRRFNKLLSEILGPNSESFSFLCALSYRPVEIAHPAPSNRMG